jgi:hypothetical protein
MMFCPQCGSQNDDASRFCAKCGLDLGAYKAQAAQQKGQAPGGGYQQPYQQPYQQAQQQYGYQQPPYQAPYQQPYQGYSPMGYGAAPRIPSYMGWAIAVLILCFWPTGIVAVVHASRVGNRLAIGDINGAMESSRKAKTWCWVTFGIAIAWIVVLIIGGIVGGWFAGGYYYWG